jgi:hypothetical protein
MIYKHTIGDLPLVVEYEYQIHADKKFPKIILVILENKWDLTEIIDHTLKEDIKSRIFKELNEVNTIS